MNMHSDGATIVDPEIAELAQQAEMDAAISWWGEMADDWHTELQQLRQSGDPGGSESRREERAAQIIRQRYNFDGFTVEAAKQFLDRYPPVVPVTRKTVIVPNLRYPY